MARSDRNGKSRVVVTGIGAITALGNDPDESWHNLLAGKSGIRTITQFDASPFPTRIAAEVDFDQPMSFVGRKDLRRMSRFVQFALFACDQAITNAGIDLPSEDSSDIGVIIGTGIGSLTTTERECGTLFRRGGMRVNPNFLPMMLPNMATSQVTRIFGIHGYSSTTVTACSSGAQAIGDAAEVIRRGGAQVMLAGGSEASICALGMSSFSVLRALSLRNDEPTRASRPFDRDRDGLVPAEGATTFVLENLDRAQRRNAPILAEITGYGTSSDAYHVVAPHPKGDGAVKAMTQALDDAAISPDEVDYINAHATSTPVGDDVETLAIKRVFGDRAYKLPVSATKSMLGHAMGASGAIEALAAILSIRDNVVHPTINYETPDPDCDLDYVPNEARELPVRTALSNSFAFGGHNVVLAFQRFEV
jgi:3-oxoacyl-[acyl-carrier-protein] synthase II